MCYLFAESEVKHIQQVSFCFVFFFCVPLFVHLDGRRVIRIMIYIIAII
jgi:hypothetical protein